MRKPPYISPSGLKIWKADQDDYYRKYLADCKMPRFPQTPAMSVGSAFDAFVKSYLHNSIYGKNHKDSSIYDLNTIFEMQVEAHVRDQAWTAGFHVFEGYKSCGALADLMLDLESSVSDPRFELTVEGIVSNNKNGVNLLGKPDVFYINSHGARVILDWKVNGYYSKAPVSPMAGYMKCRDASGQCSKSNMTMHKDCTPMKWKGMEVNGSAYLEQYNEEWATQLATYGWLLGEPIGSEIVTAVDQIACDARQTPPLLRVASHRLRVSQRFQFETIQLYQDLWDRITTGYYFKDMSREDSDGRCRLLDEEAKLLYGNPDGIDDKTAWMLLAAGG